ncbi:MAG: hypothetical protein EBV61_01525 [Actinobacteria bacterium]|nr:hypothetical protein [Actinomycetota bacterium]
MSQTLVMGILNITPDSFADGGKYFSKQDAVNQGRRLFSEGADIIDIGGESTRPGAERVSEDVKEELDNRVSDLINLGVNAEQIILDPGIGFAKDSAHNWQLLKSIERLQMLGYPLLIGASRKRFLGELINNHNPSDREFATIALTAELARQKVWAVRTHTVKPHKDAIAVIERLRK